MMWLKAILNIYRNPCLKEGMNDEYSVNINN